MQQKNRDTYYSVLSILPTFSPPTGGRWGGKQGRTETAKAQSVYWGSGAAPQAACAEGAYKWRLPFVRRLLAASILRAKCAEDNGAQNGNRGNKSLIIATLPPSVA